MALALALTLGMLVVSVAAQDPVVPELGGVWSEAVCPIPSARHLHILGPTLPPFGGDKLKGTRRWDCCSLLAADSSTDGGPSPPPLVCYSAPRVSDAASTALENRNPYYKSKSEMTQEEIDRIVSHREKLFRGIFATIEKSTGEPVKQKRRALDIGSNKGWMMEAAVREGFEEALGLENTPSYVTFSRAHFPKHTVFTDFKQLEEYAASKGQLDMVTAYHVIEHLPDPWGMLRQVVKHMAPGSYLVGEVPDACPGATIRDNTREEVERCIRPWQEHGTLKTLLAPVHMMFWTPESIAFLLDSLGFEPLRVHAYQNENLFKISFYGRLREAEN